ncbi:MAG: hypothetical protein HKP48_02125 [Winogradskyella sp.]|uniref:hypothetical protein n=1 Tax=Winogradskyella sp. TaxID=1883156 RepID=UPI00180BF4CE|nr:hypothetical protein [Winogradskyella sp.]MBT8245047.1 hypothetical protein [Winogradskyella sp.]NNK22111.1 hypothetical protein [Winogradskyella sp.]
MKKITRGIKLLSVLFLALAYLACDEDDAVLPQINAEFTQTINQDTGVVSFLNTSTNADNYQWTIVNNNNPDDIRETSEVNPIIVFESGTYTVTLIATNVAGDSDTFEDVIVISIPEVIAFPISFDNPLVVYDATVFNGVAFQIVENPDPSGANPNTSNVGEIVNSGAAFEGLFFDLGVDLDLSTDKTVKVLFWSNAPIDILLKLENGSAADTEITASHGGTGWEALYFTFDSAGSYSTTTFFVDGPGTTAGTFYIDDISQINTDDIPCTATDLEFPIDFDCETIDYASKIVGNVNFTVIDNPEQSGINNVASKVGEITNVGAAFENAFFNLDTPIDFSTENAVTLKLYATQALPVLLKFEDGTEGNVEDSQMHMGTGWEELTFTLSSTGAYNDMVLFVDGPGTTAGTFYIDDIIQGTSVVAPACTAETSESSAAADLNITFLTDSPTFIEDNIAFSVIDNPDSDNAVNNSCRVGQVARAGNSGFDNLQLDLTAKLDFNAVEGIKIKVWSPEANTPVLLKLEEIGNAGNFVEIPQTITNANEWTELTFDFAATATPQFDKMVIFFGFNQLNTNTYFFDDLMVYGAGGGGGGICVPETSESAAATDLNVSFQTDSPTFIEDNVGFSVIDNPDFDNSVNSSCRVGQVARFGNSGFDNLQLDLTDKLDFNSVEGIKLKVWSPDANTPVLLKLEEIGNAGNFVEIPQTVTNANEWTELTFDFSATATPQFDKIVIFFGFNQQNTNTYFFDDLMVYGTPGGGGGGTGGGCTTGAEPATSFPVDFEACESFTSTFASPENGIAVSLDDNPDPSGINTSASVLKVERFSGTQRFAGVQNAFPNNFNATGTFKFKVYSPVANVVMRFEINSSPQDPNSGNPGPQFATITNANTWTEVEIVFTGIPPSNTGVNQLVIKPNNPDGTDLDVLSANEVFYFDNIRLE